MTDTHGDIANELNEPANPAEDSSPIYCHTIPMPSTLTSPDPAHCAAEFAFRKKQASQLFHLLQEVITEKSFHYSHIMRNAHNKSICTRARSSIMKLNSQITF